MAVAEVRAQHAQGVDFIKVIDVTPEVFFAALEESARLKLPLPRPSSADASTCRKAAQAGLRSIEHLGPKDSVLLGCSTDEAALRNGSIEQAGARTAHCGTGSGQRDHARDRKPALGHRSERIHALCPRDRHLQRRAHARFGRPLRLHEHLALPDAHARAHDGARRRPSLSQRRQPALRSPAVAADVGRHRATVFRALAGRGTRNAGALVRRAREPGSAVQSRRRENAGRIRFRRRRGVVHSRTRLTPGVRSTRSRRTRAARSACR